MNKKNQLPDWSKQDFLKFNKIKWEYKNHLMYEGDKKENKWPWYCASLDRDIEDFLKESLMTSGKILDLGTCSGSQAIELAKRGFDVVGTDVSKTALSKAREACRSLPANTKIEFLLDDIATSGLAPNQFDLIIDRGCFHSICLYLVEEYIDNVSKLLKDSGNILLKTMSIKETRYLQYDRVGDRVIPVPYPFDPETIEKIFSERFKIEKVRESVFYSSVIDDPGKAYLTILSKR